MCHIISLITSQRIARGVFHSPSSATAARQQWRRRPLRIRNEPPPPLPDKTGGWGFFCLFF